MSFSEKSYVKGEDYCIKVTDGTHDSPKRKNNGRYLITSKHIKGRNIDFDSAYLISEDDYNKINQRSKVDQWDVLISMIGEYCGFCYVERNSKINYAVKNVGILKAGDKLKAEWLYYYFNSPQGKSVLHSRRSGTSQPYLSLDTLRKLPVLTLSSSKEMGNIVKILSTLDEKIETNNRINSRLEEMAQTIFKQWFVDFEFPDENGEPYKSSGGEMVESELGMIPAGWEVKSLDKIANYLNGLAMQKFRPESDEKSYPVLKIKELRQGSTDKSSDRCSKDIDEKYIIDDGDIVFSWSGSLLVDTWCGGKCGLNQHLFKVTSDIYDKWFYYNWTRYHLEKFIQIAKSKATTMGHIKRKDLSDSKVLVPNDEIYNKANLAIRPIYEKVIKARIESRKLAKLRDTLLPKLMSGEVRVPLDKQ